MTLELLEYNIGQIALKNNLVNAYFAGGSLYEINAEVIDEYPIIFITPAGDHTVKENTTRFNLTIYYADRLWDDDRNETDICSAGIETLKNIKRQLPMLDWVAYVQEEPIIRLFTETERMNDRLAGAYMQIWVEVLNASTCEEFLDELGRPMGNYIPGNLNVLDAYATKAWVLLQKYADKPWVLEQIENIQLSAGTTYRQVLEMIASALTEYTKTENFATINNSAITNGGNFELVTNEEFNSFSALTTEELERIIQMIGDIPMSSVTHDITVLSSITSSVTEDIILISGITSALTENITTISANTSALTENLTVLSAFTHESVSSITQDFITLSGATESALSGLSAITAEILNGIDVVLDYNTVSAMTAQERAALCSEIRSLDPKKKVWFLVREQNDAEARFVPIFGRKNTYVDFVGYYNGNNYTVILLYNDGTLEKTDKAIYALPTASSSTKGGVKVGSGLTISNEELSVSSAITGAISGISAITETLEGKQDKLTAGDNIAISGATISAVLNEVYYDYGTITAMTNNDRKVWAGEVFSAATEGKRVFIRQKNGDSYMNFEYWQSKGGTDFTLYIYFLRTPFNFNQMAWDTHNFGYRVGRATGIWESANFNAIPASTSKKGMVQIGNGLSVTNQGVLSTQYQIWTGTQSEYDNLSSHDSMTFYVITDLT